MKNLPPYDPTNDLVFKFVFGREERKNVTLRFINDLTGRDGTNAFVDLDFRNSEFVPEKQDEKLGRLDVFGILDDGSRVDIEMQVINHLNMEKRSLFYWAHMYLHFEALKSGQGYRQIHPAIAINVLRFSFLPAEAPFSQYGIYNIENQHKLTDDLELDFLEIPKYRNKPVKDMNRVERWLAYFANRLQPAEKEELAMRNPEIAEAMEASDRFFMEDKAYREYLQRESAIWDYNNDIVEGRKESEKRGEERGEERFAKLIRLLQAAGRGEEVFQAASDPALLKKLYQEFGL
ncbi:MAG: Rpn family recombination-promoting nuclease/putative transposase [Selenomonas sp.]|nr:Rpn family recombination-promoting nuclease/putative transposase [Selenomonas sp.]